MRKVILEIVPWWWADPASRRSAHPGALYYPCHWVVTALASTEQSALLIASLGGGIVLDIFFGISKTGIPVGMLVVSVDISAAADTLVYLRKKEALETDPRNAGNIINELTYSVDTQSSRISLTPILSGL